MPLPSSSYVAWQGVQTYFVDKDTGYPLSAGYVEFYSDVDRSTLKDVFQQVRNPDNTYTFVNIGSTVTLTSVGTFGSPSDGSDIQVYAYPFNDQGEIELYHMKIYSSGSILQETRDAQPANFVNNSVADTFEASENQISNPQFVETLLPDTNTNIYTVTTSTLAIAPDWYIDTTGSGTVTVTLLDLIDIAIPSTPPFAIRILSSAGITSLKLRQRIAESPRLIGTGYISGSLVAAQFGTAAVNLQMDYVASNGYTVNLVNQSTSAATGTYTTLINDESTPITTTNDDPGSTGYVDIIINIPVLTDVAITSVQVMSAQSANNTIAFIQESTPRQIDHLFHYYNLPLQHKPIPSYLTGWDFRLNPCQELGASTSTNAASSFYIADQTILFQTVPSNFTMIQDYNGLNFTSIAASSFAVIQYLDGKVAIELLNQRMSVFIQGVTSGGSTRTGTVNLYWTANGAVPVLPLSVVTAITGGKPSAIAAGWNKVLRPNYNDATFTFTGPRSDHVFSGFDATADAGINTATYLAIVISFETTSPGQVIALTAASLNRGDIATYPAPQSSAQIIQDCQYYYEKSYNVTDLPGTISVSGQLIRPQRLDAGVGVKAAAFDIEYNTVKRIVTPNVYLYSPRSATINQALAVMYTNGTATAETTVSSANWTINVGSGQKNIAYTANGNINLQAGAGNEAFIAFHYVVDARLGIV